MNPFLKQADDTFTAAGIDFKGLLSWHLVHGAVVCNADAFALGYHSASGTDFEAVTYPHSDTLFVVWCSGDMLAALLPFVDRYERIAWQRDFKDSPRVRCYRMADVYEKLKK